MEQQNRRIQQLVLENGIRIHNVRGVRDIDLSRDHVRLYLPESFVGVHICDLKALDPVIFDYLLRLLKEEFVLEEHVVDPKGRLAASLEDSVRNCFIA